MKIITKIAILSLCAAPIAIGVATPALLRNDNDVLNAVPNKTYSISKYGRTLELDGNTLMFKVISDDGTTWLSSDVNPEDKITSYRKAFLESALTIYFMTKDAGESNFSIFDSAHKKVTKARVSEINDGFAVKCMIVDGPRAKPNLSLDVTFELKLVEKGISLKITEIKEYESKNSLSKIVLYPAFASSYKQVDGYMLIPDGSGALIDLNKPTSAKTLLSLDVYDSDIGLMDNNRKATTSEILTLPMYALNENDRSTLVYIVDGEEYATLNAKASGIIDNYNYSYFTFNLRDIYYSYQGIGESTKTPQPQKDINDVKPEIIYELIPEKLEYYDFAKRYQDHLKENNLLNKASDLNNDMRLEFLMSENKDSMFGKEVFAMTTVDFIKDKVQELLNENIKPSVALLGYSKGGITNSYPNCFPIEGKTGSKRSYQELGTYLKENDIDYSFIVDFIRSYENSGISTQDLAMNMSEKYISSNDYNVGNKTKYNQLTLNATDKKYQNSISYLDEYNGSGFDFLSEGSKLYSSYFNQKFTRTDAKKYYQSMLNNFKGSIGLRKPNEYMFGNFDSYLDMATSSSGFIMENNSIPFLQMVLSGFKNMYSPAINLNYTGKTQILNLIDYNVNPTFLLSQESAIKLLDTSTNHVFSSQYDDWKQDIFDIYKQVNNKLEQVEGANFIKREVIANDVILNTYSNGKSIVINYSNNDFTYNGRVIKALESEVF